jgi:hypothetical protein
MRKCSFIVALAAWAAAAGADSGDRYYVHYDLIERGAVGAATKAAETWRDAAAEFENADIAMAAEEVVIVLHPKSAAVTATFDFENTSLQPRGVDMCFPLSYGMLGTDAYEVREEKSTVAGRAADLAVTVDGDAASYRIEEVGLPWDFPALATWPVHFEAGAKRRVVCRYNDVYNGGGGMTLDLSVVYMLATGATWKGPIGRGRVIVRPGADFDWSVPLYYLAAGVPPARDDGGEILWEFANLEPPFECDVNAPAEGCYYRYARMDFAGVRVGFIKPSTMESGYAHSSYRVPEGPGAPAGVLVDNLNFRVAPDAGAARVAGKPTLAKDEGLLVLERRGEWYRAQAFGGCEGWVRWRYVDPDTGAENIYVELALNCE